MFISRHALSYRVLNALVGFFFSEAAERKVHSSDATRATLRSSWSAL